MRSATSGVTDPDRRVWLDYADLVLQRAALLCRATRGRPPDPLAGLRVTESLEELLQSLPGIGGAQDAEAAQRIRTETTPQVEAALESLMRMEIGDDPFGEIVANCDLTAAEACVLALLVAVERDVHRQRLVAYLNDDVSARWLTPHALRLAFPAPDDDREALLAVAPGSGLRRAELLRREDDSPWAAGAVRLHPDVLWWIFGDQRSGELPVQVRRISARGLGDADFAVVIGDDRVRRIQAAIGALQANEFLFTRALDEQGWESVVRAASLNGSAIVVDVDGELAGGLADRIERTRHLSWAISVPSGVALDSLPRRAWIHVQAGPAEATTEEVAAALGGEAQLTVSLTADQLDLVAAASAAMGGDTAAAVRRLAAGGPKPMIEHVPALRGWDDLILAEPALTYLREVAARARFRHRVYDEWGFDSTSSGVLALFAGPSGTGKSLAAEVIASSLGLDLYRVDLSRVVDKYIGETEKNLDATFRAAQASPMVLLLDEADALLAKRTAVSDAHDRYANIEVAYLLQRLERHRGVVVLASNLATNLDAAFLRRIDVSVTFLLPRPRERRLIWDRYLPPSARGPDLDLDLLAEALELSGGQIRNAAVRAAFLAAETREHVSMSQVVEASLREMVKAGRIFPSDSFPDVAPWIHPEAVLESPVVKI